MKKKIVLLSLLLFGSTLALLATDRHVYSGNSIQTQVDACVSGDRVIIHAGTYSQVVSLGNKTGITITNAGDGEVIVQGDSNTGSTFWIQNSSSIVISNLTIKNTRKLVWSTGITVIGSGSDIQILNNKLTDISYRSGAFDATDNPDNHGAQFQGVNAISIVGDNAASSYSNIIIKDNEVSYCMTGWSEAIALKGNVNGFNVENNKVHHITNIGIDAFGLGSYPALATNNQARNGSIQKNEVYNCICNYTDNGGIYIDGGYNITVMNNKVYNNIYGITVGCENQMVKPDGATENIEIRNNLVYNNRKAGIMVGTGGDDDGQQGITRYCKVTGNTFLKNATGDQWSGEFMLQNANHIEFYNNIFFGTVGRLGTVNNGSVSNTFGYNIFYAGGATVDFSKQTGTSTWTSQTLAQFKTDLGDNSSTSQDPRIVNASVGSIDAHLQSTSPGINTGKPAFATISGELDLDGQGRISGAAIDIGIDEYGSSGGVAVTGVAVSPGSASLAVAATQQLTATISPANATNQTKTWTSNNSGVASVNASGLVTAVSAGTAIITVTTQDGNLNATSTITVTAASGSLPSPWTTADIGAVGATGSASHSGGAFTVVGSGADVWGTADEFRYVYRTLSGNGEIIARLSSLTNTNAWAKAGVMIRETLTADSKHAFCAVTPSNGVIFQRHLPGDVNNQNNTAGITAPRWLRLVRAGNIFTAYYASNGSSWTQLGTETISMNTSVYIGLAVTSHNDGVLCTSVFDNVSVTSAGTPGTTITIDGSLADWSNVSAITTASSQTSTSLKVYSNPTTLFFGIAGSGMSATDYQIFINSDNNAATGYQDPAHTSSGADYMIENGTFYQSTGTAWGWNNAAATISASKNSGATEVSINRSAFASVNATIKVSYKDIVSWSAVSKLPASGGYATYSLSSGARLASPDYPSFVKEESDAQVTSVYPNPVTAGNFDVKFHVPIKSEVQCLMTDPSGRQIYYQDLGIKDAGVHTHKVETSLLPKGLYAIKLRIGSSVQTQKLVCQ